MNLARLATLLIFAAAPMLSSASYIVLDTHAYGSSTYKLVAAADGNGNYAGGIGWTASQNAAIALGGNLATVNDAAENAEIFNQWGTTVSVSGVGNVAIGGLWIGLNDADVEGTWEWISGEVSGYTNWQTAGTTEPNGDGDYVHMWGAGLGGPGNGTWNDSPAHYTGQFGKVLFGVVEIAAVPEPSTAALLGLVLAGLGFGARKPRAI